LATFRDTGVLNIGVALRSAREELYALITHGIGWLLSVAGVIALLDRVSPDVSPLLAVACSFYGLALVGVFGASTLSHLILPEKWNSLFRSLDQGFIYLLIVGTMSPLVVKLNPEWPWLALLAVLIGVAAFGFVTKTLFAHQLQQVSLWLYLVLGWGQVIAFGPLLLQLPYSVFSWIVVGGLTYSVGYIFLIVDLRRYHFHAVWHVFVMLGSACHYLAIWRWVSA
jgi:hemolysin III